MTLPLLDLIAEMNSLDGDEKIKFLLTLARELPSPPEGGFAEEHQIKGCASQAYLMGKCEDGRIYFQGDSDAQIPKGLIALFVLGCSGADPKEILDIPMENIQSIGLQDILSPSRVNGAYHIIQKVREIALQCEKSNG